ncbi:MAG: DUF3494 domain-containing protein, partial [Deinococcales bacterium]|nr:DUF3494 domain-containing protein [Chitinophagaceae bacterium]
MKQLNLKFKHICYLINTKKTWLFVIAALFTTFIFAQAPKAFAPVLGNAASFAVFGGNAGITNQGVNTITHGSIGTVAASTFITGFHDGVTGAVYTETGTNLGNATGGIYANVPAPGTATTFSFASLTFTDAMAAFNSISPAAQPGGIDPNAGELGGLTLTPGVYKAVTFNITNLDLTLDAQGDPNAVWVFQTSAALTVGKPGPTGARSVKMINGGLARNVFWYVGSAATINSAGGGEMTGTIISSANITFSTAGNAVQTVLNGRALSLNASVTMVNTTVNACDTWTGLTSNAWSTATNWSTGGVPVSSEEVLIPNVSTNQPVVSSSTSSLHNLTLYTGSALTVTSTLQVGGFINNLGNNFAATSGTIVMNGTIPQTIPANTFTNFNTVQNLIINNAIGVALGGTGNINVSNLFTLSNGLLTTGNNILIINNNATAGGASAARYVNGNVRKVGNQAFTFPVGMSSRYAPISISAPTNASDHFTASYVATDPDPMYPRSSLGAGLNKVSSTEYWQLNRTNGVSNVDVTLSFDGTRSGGITTLADLRVANWNGTTWINQGNTGTTGNIGNNPAGTVKSNPALAVFGPFTFGSSTANNSLLPLSLLSFSAQLLNNNTNLAWETTNEVNASHFNVQRSKGVTSFNTVGTINTKGGGNYTYIDNLSTLTSTASSIFYRLQIVDNNGDFTYSKTVAVTPNTTTKSVRIFPNPV